MCIRDSGYRGDGDVPALPAPPSHEEAHRAATGAEVSPGESGRYLEWGSPVPATQQSPPRSALTAQRLTRGATVDRLEEAEEAQRLDFWLAFTTPSPGGGGARAASGRNAVRWARGNPAYPGEQQLD